MTTPFERGSPTPGAGGQVLHLDTHHNASTDRRAPIGPVEARAWAAVVAATAVLGVAGFVNSFERVNERMAPYFGGLAWTVPLAIDLGILIFTALDLLMAYRDMRSVWLRYVPRALVAVTIYLNVVGETALEGRIAHAVLPGVWVIAVEVAGTAVRSIFGLRTERRTMDRIRRSRWALAPRTTLRLRRRMILTEETNLTVALERDLAYELARADLRDRYGWLGLGWRLRAPRRTKLLLRRGAITPGGPATLALAPQTGPEATGGTSEKTGRDTASSTGRDTGPGGGDQTRDRTRYRSRDQQRSPTRTTAGANGAGAEGVDLDGLVETIAARYATDGRRLSRRALIAEVRAAGHQLGTKRATELLARHTTRATTRATARGESRGTAPTGGHTLAGFPPVNPPGPTNGDSSPEFVTSGPERGLGVLEGNKAPAPDADTTGGNR